MMAIDATRLPPELQPDTGGEVRAATLPPAVLAEAALPEMAAEWVSAIDAGWTANVLQR
jgi:hypothetical protein